MAPYSGILLGGIERIALAQNRLHPMHDAACRRETVAGRDWVHGVAPTAQAGNLRSDDKYHIRPPTEDREGRFAMAIDRVDRRRSAMKARPEARVSSFSARPETQQIAKQAYFPRLFAYRACDRDPDVWLESAASKRVRAWQARMSSAIGWLKPRARRLSHRVDRTGAIELQGDQPMTFA